MKIGLRGYLFKIRFVGDSTTPIYSFRMYKKRKYWFAKFLWEETIRRENIYRVEETCKWVLEEYRKDIGRWSTT